MIRVCLAASALALAAALAACAGDETVSGYGAGGGVWRLIEMDGAPYGAEATLEFPAPGRVAGHGPCNRFSGAQAAPYPWFRAERILSTRRACPDLQAESAYFRALGEMTLAEVQGEVLILSNDDGRELVFRRAADAQP